MTVDLDAICFRAHDPAALVRFWAGLLRREAVGDDTLAPAEDGGFRLRFLGSDEPKIAQNRAHFDLTSATLDEQRETVSRALALGGRHTDVGQLPEEEHVVLADPEGNEFCVIEPGNNFLAGCGFIGALSCDGTPEVGRFWSAALGWPLVWDQDEETAIQAPDGGPKITWGGPPYMPRRGADRLGLDLAVPAGDRATEVDRLISLGATRTASGTMADPDGNEFRLLTV
jgi:catechol 2,3-dioxygenase-like lactoylglutathione lyase family enzyme